MFYSKESDARADFSVYKSAESHLATCLHKKSKMTVFTKRRIMFTNTFKLLYYL